MGQVLKAINFFSDDITIDVHSATRAAWLGRRRIGDIIGERRASLSESDNGDYVLELWDGPRKSSDFAVGPPV